MKILFSALAPPFPPTNGHRLRNWALLRALKAEGHQVALISFAAAGESTAGESEMAKLCQSVEWVPLPFATNGQFGSYGSRLGSLVSAMPYGAWRHRSPAMTSKIREQLGSGNFDLIICDDIYNLPNLPRQTIVPVVLNKHDITHVIVQRYLKYERNPWKLGYSWIEYCKLCRWEKKACSGVARVFVCSEHDREVLQARCAEAQFAVVPNAIDADAYSSETDDDGRTVAYVGALDWFPNQDAVGFFADSILPLVRRLSPDVQFRVIGRNPPEKLRQRLRARDGVELVGATEDVRSEMARAAVCVVPLRIGSGTRLKIVEAALMAKPVVSTRVGAEGLALREGEEIILADTPEEFACAVASLLGDRSRRRAMGQAARRRAEELYSFPALRNAVRKALERLV